MLWQLYREKLDIHFGAINLIYMSNQKIFPKNKFKLFVIHECKFTNYE